MKRPLPRVAADDVSQHNFVVVVKRFVFVARENGSLYEPDLNASHSGGLLFPVHEKRWASQREGRVPADRGFVADGRIDRAEARACCPRGLGCALINARILRCDADLHYRDGKPPGPVCRGLVDDVAELRPGGPGDTLGLGLRLRILREGAGNQRPPNGAKNCGIVALGGLAVIR